MLDRTPYCGKDLVGQLLPARQRPVPGGLVAGDHRRTGVGTAVVKPDETQAGFRMDDGYGTRPTVDSRQVRRTCIHWAIFLVGLPDRTRAAECAGPVSRGVGCRPVQKLLKNPGPRDQD
ncbi:hypothetical protein O3Q52_06850 [Streptomyces sp. ActVer]|uniref:hypothetical protein n=1 Tax=Streptomyces sp. ActVer TaxID=3014558 RepID=UPI0022B38835|nr:hypothetical protein [Streptomyces sp. ActVer]MCZ4507922.1 hypothetical protein [Streptomyces sp. ActVer]